MDAEFIHPIKWRKFNLKFQHKISKVQLKKFLWWVFQETKQETT